MGEFILSLVASALDIACTLTGAWLVRLLSLGRWRGEDLNGHEARTHAAAGALTFVLDGQRVVTAVGLTLIGMAFYGLLAGALVYWMMRS
jgi:hypothetical protein